MAVISTQDLFERFFEGKDPETVRKTRAQVDRPEVYAYEAKVGKQLVEMNEEELFEMICSFGNKKSAVREGLKIGSGTFKKYVSNFRLIFQFYIDNFEVIRNPFHSAKFKGIEADTLLAHNKNRFTYEQLDEIISKLHTVYDHEHADYYELIIRLFYDGFAESQEIANLQENQINFRKKEVRLPGRTIKLSDRCFELLTSVHDMQIMEGMRGNSYMMSWHGGYFKFVVRPAESDGFQNKDLTDLGRKINTILSAKVSKEFGIDIGYRKLYLLGFYDTLVEKYGEERTKEIITSIRVSKDVSDLAVVMNDYGLVIENMTYLKRNLLQFI